MHFRILPEMASTFAEEHDPLFWYITAVTVIMTIVIFVGVWRK